MEFRSRLVPVENTPEAVNDLYLSERWGDGLPVVPPTVERLLEMLRHTDRAPADLIATVAPGFGEATVERIAINAILAGCRPSYLPVLITAVEAIAQQPFNLQAIQTTTNPATVMLLVNGPAARQLRINGSSNCLGQGWRANATIGRALRLVLQNVGRALPGDMDRATHGQPGKYSLCCAEDEAASPWEPLHVERGFEPGTSTVTAVGVSGTLNMLSVCNDADEFLRAVGDTMAFPLSNDYLRGGKPLVILGPEHAGVLATAGLRKADVKRRLWESSRQPAERFPRQDLARLLNSRGDELGPIGPEMQIPISVSPEDITIVVAGGPGTHSVYLPTFGMTSPVTRAITDRTGAPIRAFGEARS